jgi:hypothetical protein
MKDEVMLYEIPHYRCHTPLGAGKTVAIEWSHFWWFKSQVKPWYRIGVVLDDPKHHPVVRYFPDEQITGYPPPLEER